MQPSKYSTLKQVESIGLNTPKMLLIKADNQSEIQAFIDRFDYQQLFIIRSVQACEDLEGHSYAGYFWSSSAVLGKDVNKTIELAEKRNATILQTMGLNEAPRLMLQTFIKHSVGGVLFSPWSFFSAYSLVEYSTKSVQEAVEGHTQAALIASDKQYSPHQCHCTPYTRHCIPHAHTATL